MERHSPRSVGACRGIGNVLVQDNKVSMGHRVPGTSLIRVMGAADQLAIVDNTGSTAVNGIEAGPSELTNSTIEHNTFRNVTNAIANYSGC